MYLFYWHFARRFPVIAAVIVAAMSSTVGPTFAQVHIAIDDGDAGFSTTGAFTAEAAGFNGGGGADELFETSATAAAGANSATWAFSSVASGSYFISGTWVQAGNRTTAAQYSTTDGGGLVLINQRSGQTFTDKTNATNTGNGWVNLTSGPLAITDGTVSVTVTDTIAAASNFLMVDAVRITPYSTTAGVYFIDNVVGNGNGFTQTGAWTNGVTGNDGTKYFGDEQFQSTANNGATASWNFTSLANQGDYRVSTTWFEQVNRTTAASYAFTDGASSVSVNQQLAPSGFSDQGQTWQNLTQVSILDGTFSVTASHSVAGLFLMADAVRLEWLPPEITVTGNGNNVADGSAAVAGNDTQFGTVITGAAPVVHTFTVSNSGTGSLLNGTATTTASPFSISTQPSSSVAASGGSTSLGVTMATGTIGSFAESVSFGTNDTDEATFNFGVTGTVLDHADAEFVSGTANSLTLDFGVVTAGSGTLDLDYQFTNLPASLRAALDLDTIFELTDPSGRFSTNATTFLNLAAGGNSSVFDVFFNTTGLTNGIYTAQYQFTLSDENLPGATSQTLNLFVSAQVVPEPASIAVWTLLGIGLVGVGCRGLRRKTS